MKKSFSTQRSILLLQVVLFPFLLIAAYFVGAYVESKNSNVEHEISLSIAQSQLALTLTETYFEHSNLLPEYFFLFLSGDKRHLEQLNEMSPNEEISNQLSKLVKFSKKHNVTLNHSQLKEIIEEKSAIK